MNLEIMQVNWRPRREAIEWLFASTNPTKVREFFEENNIRYIYLVGDQAFTIDPTQLEIEKVFENGLVKIYQFRGKI